MPSYANESVFSLSSENVLRSLVAECCGGEKFDLAGGGYSFSVILREEAMLRKSNVAGDKTSALLAFSVADPTKKMHPGAVMSGLEYYFQNCDSTRYHNNIGIILKGRDANEMLSHLLALRGSEWVQYSWGSIKGALSEIIPTAFFTPGDTLVFPNPGYGVIKSPMNSRGIQVINVDMEQDVNGRWHIPLDKIKLPNTGNRFMYLNNPHNPTGTAYSRAELSVLIEWALQNRVVLIVDEAYINIIYSDAGSILDVPGWERCCIVLQSVSKGWSATGLRFGWMIANPKVIELLRKVSDVKDSGMFGPSIMMGLTCLAHREWANGTKQYYENLHRQLYTGLNYVGFQGSFPDAGLCQFYPAPKALNGVELRSQVFNGVQLSSVEVCAKKMREEMGISVMHANVAGKGYLRFAVTIKPVPECGLDNEEMVIDEAVRRIRANNFEF